MRASIIGSALILMAVSGCRTERAETVSAGSSPEVGEYRFGIEGAPLQYRGDAAATIITAGQVPVHVFCTDGAPTDRVALACTSADRKVIVMPNPCEFADSERYARLLCHEMGHVNGWEHDVPQ